jgi:hypothetical protein
MSIRTDISHSSPWMRILMQSAASAMLLYALFGCAIVDPVVYAGQKPELVLETYFNGQLTGHGLLMGRSGEIKRRFVVDLSASWSGETGTLDEQFVWSDGERQHRVWTLKRAGAGRYIGTAPDVVGEAQGVVSGNSLTWSYMLAVPVDGATWNLHFDDAMFLVDENVMLNRAVMTKWGLRVGEIFIAFDRKR